jgi:hypothetical protein
MRTGRWASFCFETGFLGATACFPTASLIKKPGSVLSFHVDIVG